MPYLKKGSGKALKTHKNCDRKTSKRAYHPTKEEIHALTTFAKNTMKKESFDIDKELVNFKNMSVSGDKKNKE